MAKKITQVLRRNTLNPYFNKVANLKKGEYRWVTCPKKIPVFNFYNGLQVRVAVHYGKGKYSIHTENNLACIKVTRL